MPLPKLLYVGLLRLWTDFRVGMVCVMVLLAVVSALFIIVARRLRGSTRWTDAFFPLAFLHLGHWENFTWGWQIQFILATALAAGVLLLVASGRPIRSPKRALLMAGLLVAIPLTGATALPFAPVMAILLVLETRRQAPGARLAKAVTWGGGLLTVVVTGLYFLGLQHPSWVPESPGIGASARTGVKVLALAFGPAAGGWWFAAGLAAIAVFGLATFFLVRARAWPLLAFLGAAVSIAFLVGDGRAGLVDSYGLPDRYAIIGVPGLCCVYFAFDRYGRGRWARFGPAALCLGLVALYPLNAHIGMEFRDWYQHRLDTFSAEVAAGVPVEELTYYWPLASDPDEMRVAMSILRRQKVGVFADLRETPTGSRATRWVDGLDSETRNWFIIGSAGRALLEGPEGEHRLAWNYDVSDTWAALGLAFPRPQDWRGMGSLEVNFTGEGTGNVISIRLGVANADGTVDRYDSLFLDNRFGPRTIIIPWTGFGHVDQSGVFDLKGPLPLDQVVSVTFIAMQPGAGKLTLERVGLVPGPSQLGWPLHPSAERRSLAPWR